MSTPRRDGIEEAGDSAVPGRDLKQISAESSHSIKQKALLQPDPPDASANQPAPEHDDGPMEEIQLHTDTEPAINESQEEPQHYPNTARQSSYPPTTETQPLDPALSNGSPSIEQTTQAASAAVAEAIAAANRAAQESSGGILA